MHTSELFCIPVSVKTNAGVDKAAPKAAALASLRIVKLIVVGVILLALNPHLEVTQWLG